MAHFKTITCIFLFERDKLDGRRKKLYLFIYLFIYWLGFRQSTFESNPKVNEQKWKMVAKIFYKFENVFTLPHWFKIPLFSRAQSIFG